MPGFGGAPAAKPLPFGIGEGLLTEGVLPYETRPLEERLSVTQRAGGQDEAPALGQLAGESARMGLDPFLGFMALISINLAILNLLPVPVLDGGQFLFLVAEAVVRRPLPLKLRERLTMLGLVLIVLLMGLAFSNDLRRLFG